MFLNPARAAASLLLILSLLLAQWAGMVHRLEHMHGHWQDSPLSLLLSPSLDPMASSEHADHEHQEHSCVAFDGAALCDIVATLLPQFLKQSALYSKAALIFYLSVQSKVRLHFMSQAPPA